MSNTMLEGPSGKLVKVLGDNQLSVISESITPGAYTAYFQRHVTILTEDVTLTSDSESMLLWIKYIPASNTKLFITNYIFTNGDSTGGGTNDTRFTLYKNGTSGTIVSGATNATVRNRNFSGPDVIPGLAYVGQEGRTLTDGTNVGIVTLSSTTRRQEIEQAARPFVLERNNTFAIGCIPPSGNTNMTVRAIVFAYQAQIEE